MSGANFFPPITILQAGINPLASHGGNNEPGWISGDVANLAASGQVFCIFDLGRNWQQLALVVPVLLPVGPSSGFSSVNCTFNDTNAFNASRRPPIPGVVGYTTNFSTSITTASGAQGTSLKPMGRYMIVSVTNADAANPVGSTATLVLSLHYK